MSKSKSKMSNMTQEQVFMIIGGLILAYLLYRDFSRPNSVEFNKRSPKAQAMANADSGSNAGPVAASTQKKKPQAGAPPVAAGGISISDSSITRKTQPFAMTHSDAFGGPVAA